MGADEFGDLSVFHIPDEPSTYKTMVTTMRPPSATRNVPTLSYTEPVAGEQFEMKLEGPGWSGLTTIKLNGEALNEARCPDPPCHEVLNALPDYSAGSKLDLLIHMFQIESHRIIRWDKQLVIQRQGTVQTWRTINLE